MLDGATAFSGFSSNDIRAARSFYGITRGDWGPPMAWFTDPAGNIVSLVESAAH